jgi:hypothetical protein
MVSLPEKMVASQECRVRERREVDREISCDFKQKRQKPILVAFAESSAGMTPDPTRYFRVFFDLAMSLMFLVSITSHHKGYSGH